MSWTSGSWHLRNLISFFCLSFFFSFFISTLQQTQQDRIVFSPPSVVLRIAPFPEQPLGYNTRTTSGFISCNFSCSFTSYTLLQAIHFASSSRLRPCHTKSLYLNCYSLLPLALLALADRQASRLTD